MKGDTDREGGIIYVGDKLVMSSVTEDVRIYYAIHDTKPSDESEWTLYTDPVPVKKGMEGSIRVWAYAAGNAYEDSDV
ncbi:MAG: chitobiase/beta-hexosaminidase C-terminal domain-containing protein, partial [Lachnospiraceae bacterium]|nr:chitobiase/beta-hexosaminidase C-terminal domain-containing protein [Lachnospiraceae bacterium]